LSFWSFHRWHHLLWTTTLFAIFSFSPVLRAETKNDIKHEKKIKERKKKINQMIVQIK
jgi:hypothetical protein